MQKTIKFGDVEREKIISYLKSSLNIKLEPVGNRKKFCIGSNGNYYCIVGGTGDSHSIPKDVMNVCIQYADKSYLILARLLRTKMDLYLGSMKPLIESRSILSSVGKGGDHYGFNIKTPSSNQIGIKEVGSCHLEKIGEFPYEFESARKEDKEVKKEFNEYWRKLSSIEKNILLEKYGTKTE